MTMLEVDRLTVRYANSVAVDALTFSIGAGEAVALLGPNSAGKTSTLRAVSGLVDAADGSITFDGEQASRARPETLARRGLVHVPEGRHAFSTLTVNDNLLVGTTGRAGRESLFSIGDVYDLFPALSPLRRRLGWGLSGGEQQMVAIGRALLASPRLLMLDEPSLGLAPIVVKAVYAALAQIKSRMSILLVEQNASTALNLCDRGVVLVSGRTVLTGTASELNDRQTLVSSYFGQTALPQRSGEAT